MMDHDAQDKPFAPATLRRVRCDGWTPEVQREFVEALAITGSVTAAARSVDRHPSSAYRLRSRPEAAAFRAAWNAASATAYQRLHDLAMDRVVTGVEEPVLDKNGICVYRKTVYDNKLLMFLMNHLRPDEAPRVADASADMLSHALAALDAAPAPLELPAPVDELEDPEAPFRTLEFTPDEAAALARHGIKVERVAQPEAVERVADSGAAEATMAST